MKLCASALHRWWRALRFWEIDRARPFVLLLLLGSLAGCGPVEPKADLTIVNGAEPESLDPAIITGQPDGRIASALFEGLTRLDAVSATPEPGLAERWEISEGGRVYTFHLRTNAVWSTGEPISAADVVYSWRRVVDPRTAADYAGQLYFVKKAEEINTAKIADVTQLGVWALDAHTVRVELVAPTPFFLDLCAFRTLAVVPQFWIEKHGDRWLAERPMPTSGAYVLDYWRIQEKVRLRRNPRYWDAAQTRNEIVDLLPLDSASAAINLYATRMVDIIWDKNLIPTELMDTLRDRPDCHTFDYLGTYFLRFNLERKPFGDVRVRQAMAMAIDKKRIVDRITRSGEKPANTITPPGTVNYQAPEGLGYHPEEARRLLAAAGFPNGQGFPAFSYLFNTAGLHQQIAVELKEMWRKELGLNMELRQTEWKVYLSAQSKLDFDTCRSSWIGDYNDPNTFLDMFMSNNGNNRTGWKNLRYDQLMREGNAQTNPQRRRDLLREAESILVHDELPIIPVFFYVGVNFFDPKVVEGVSFNILDQHPLRVLLRKK